MNETLRGRARDVWVRSVLVVCNSATDTSTVKEWVRSLGISERRFRDQCAVLGVSPKASLDFGRMLRLVVQGKTNHPDDELTANDMRTIRKLLRQAGLLQDAPPLDVRHYLQYQTFIASTECLEELAARLTNSQ